MQADCVTVEVGAAASCRSAWVIALGVLLTAELTTTCMLSRCMSDVLWFAAFPRALGGLQFMRLSTRMMAGNAQAIAPKDTVRQPDHWHIFVQSTRLPGNTPVLPR